MIELTEKELKALEGVMLYNWKAGEVGPRMQLVINALQPILRGRGWLPVEEALGPLTAEEAASLLVVHHMAMDKVLASRRARLGPVRKVDKAVEVVKHMFIERATYANEQDRAESLVAAVRAADAEAKR